MLLLLNTKKKKKKTSLKLQISPFKRTAWTLNLVILFVQTVRPRNEINIIFYNW